MLALFFSALIFIASAQTDACTTEQVADLAYLVALATDSCPTTFPSSTVVDTASLLAAAFAAPQADVNECVCTTITEEVFLPNCVYTVGTVTIDFSVFQCPNVNTGEPDCDLVPTFCNTNTTHPYCHLSQCVECYRNGHCKSKKYNLCHPEQHICIDDTQCFASEDSFVMSQTQGKMLMKDVEVADYIQACDGSFTRVLGKIEHEGQHSVLRFQTSETSFAVTPKHLINIDGDYVVASEINVGDVIAAGVVESIKVESASTLNIATVNSDIMVNGACMTYLVEGVSFMQYARYFSAVYNVVPKFALKFCGETASSFIAPMLQTAYWPALAFAINAMFTASIVFAVVRVPSMLVNKSA